MKDEFRLNAVNRVWPLYRRLANPLPKLFQQFR